MDLGLCEEDKLNDDDGSIHRNEERNAEVLRGLSANTDDTRGLVEFALRGLVGLEPVDTFRSRLNDDACSFLSGLDPNANFSEGCKERNLRRTENTTNLIKSKF